MFGIGKKKEVAEALSVAPAATMAEMQPAGFWLRVVAVVVDSALMMILLGVMMIGAAGAGEDLVAPAYWLWVLISFLYWPVMESTARRGTAGKMMLGLVVADIDGGRLPFLRSLLRNLAKIISAIPFYIGFLLAAFTARKQALHDLITKAVVLRQGGSSFVRAVGVLVVGIALFVAGGYLAADYLMDVIPKEMQAMMGGEPPAPQKSPAMAKLALKPAPAPVAKAAAPPAAAGPVAATTPAPAPAAPAPETPAAAPAPVVKPAAAPAPVAKPVAPVKFAAAPKPTAVQEPKPAAVPESKPVPPAPVRSTRPRLEAPQPLSGPGAVPPPPPVSPKFNDVMTAVVYGDREAVAQLLDLGRWSAKRDSNGLTPLMIAAFSGDSGMVRLLLERGADPRLLAPGGLTALEFAQQSGDAATMQLLQPGGAR
jgi:uncharacterized RDD family membrane protein YckC